MKTNSQFWGLLILSKLNSDNIWGWALLGLAIATFLLQIAQDFTERHKR